ncbi:LysM peptidoglycan-binding domain-containing protein [Anatilimnocola floriformis]|uniref:LysM peptidoglycan-binding domain-containing protein n=1 Tax=Anatilimnocola floriformis TaxID=2948575 RepID=UPI0020C3C906|nr:hypothetical protein [Anatilimnocola floriformis]
MSYRRYLVAGGVIAGGAALAWPFRHPQQQRPAPQALAVNHEVPGVTWSTPQDLTHQVHSQPGISPVPELPPVTNAMGTSPGIPGRLTRPATYQTVPANGAPLESLPAPPLLPMAYESLLVPVGSEPPAPKTQPATANLPVHEPLLPSADEVAAAKEAQVRPGPLWRKHRIVEGDNLAALAIRYLGDASRAGEIHVANIDRLMSPDILPLGVTLLIPPRVSSEALP